MNDKKKLSRNATINDLFGNNLNMNKENIQIQKNQKHYGHRKRIKP